MSGTTTPYRFGGQFGYYRDKSTLLSVRARELDTSKGRWPSRDPIGVDGGDWNVSVTYFPPSAVVDNISDS